MDSYRNADTQNPDQTNENGINKNVVYVQLKCWPLFWISKLTFLTHILATDAEWPYNTMDSTSMLYGCIK